MFKQIKRAADQLRHDDPGRRFRNRYERVRKTGAPGILGRLMLYGAALIAFAIGVVLVFIPGPAILFFFITGGLLATESQPVARFLDWSELRLRSLVERLLWWRRNDA